MQKLSDVAPRDTTVMCLNLQTFGATNAKRRPRLRSDGAGPDDLEGKHSGAWRMIYGCGRIASTAGFPARHFMPTEPVSIIPLTSRPAPVIGRLTRGSFAIWTSDPCQLRLGGLARTWGMYGNSVAIRAGRLATDNRHPTGYADQGPSTAGLHPSRPERQAGEGSREVRKADCALT